MNFPQNLTSEFLMMVIYLWHVFLSLYSLCSLLAIPSLDIPPFITYLNITQRKGLLCLLSDQNSISRATGNTVVARICFPHLWHSSWYVRHLISQNHWGPRNLTGHWAPSSDHKDKKVKLKPKTKRKIVYSDSNLKFLSRISLRKLKYYS